MPLATGRVFSLGLLYLIPLDVQQYGPGCSSVAGSRGPGLISQGTGLQCTYDRFEIRVFLLLTLELCLLCILLLPPPRASSKQGLCLARPYSAWDLVCWYL